ncbi:MAG: gluconokinase [Rhodobacteraceae bacterium]|nr:gluconokinase [Paracoccaceae bacterium]
MKLQGTKGISIVVMGVCGVGKSSVSSALAHRLGAALVEADDHHTQNNKDKMSKGIPLNDDDRKPWLAAVAEVASSNLETNNSVVIACSALKRKYRDQLRSALTSCIFVHLDGDRDLIAKRLGERKGHFVGESLLKSQLEALEPLSADEPGFSVSIAPPAEAVVEKALNLLEDSLAKA